MPPSKLPEERKLMPAELFLIRHGQSTWNTEQRCQGRLNFSHLTPQGIEQAQALARDLAGKDITAIYSSEQHRATETAQIIADALGLSVIIDARLGEMDQGEWQGLTFPEIKERYAESYAKFTEDPTLVIPPGGESIRQLARRTEAGANAIAARHKGQRVAIVSHEIPLGALHCKSKGLPINKVWKEAPHNGQFAVVVWPPQGQGMLAMIMRWFSYRQGLGGTS
jgi:probable phosphoglycerate mutase